MPIGTVYRPPPRKRSTPVLANADANNKQPDTTSSATPTSPLPQQLGSTTSLGAKSDSIVTSSSSTSSDRSSPAETSGAIPRNTPNGVSTSAAPPRANSATDVASLNAPVKAPTRRASTPPRANTAHASISGVATASLPPKPSSDTYGGYGASANLPPKPRSPDAGAPRGSVPPRANTTLPVPQKRPTSPRGPPSYPRAPSSPQAPAGSSTAAVAAPAAASSSTTEGAGTRTMTSRSSARYVVPGKILIVYYSMYGHIRLLADSVREGIESVAGCSTEIFRVPETLSPEVLKKMNAPEKYNDPELTHDMLHKLREASGIMFGMPARFGMMPAQMKQLFDSTVKLWTKGDLVGKPAGLFFSTATQGGGQESTALTTITQLAHHGMIYVPPGYSFGGAMFDNSEVHGGSPYGCGTISNGDGSRLPSKYELDFARHQGAQFASVALKLSM